MFDEVVALLELCPPPDMSRVETPEDAVKVIHGWVRSLAGTYGDDPDQEVFVHRPERGEFGRWEVCWEAGPYYWAVEMTGQHDLSGPYGHLECGYGFTICIEPSEEVAHVG